MLREEHFAEGSFAQLPQRVVRAQPILVEALQEEDCVEHLLPRLLFFKVDECRALMLLSPYFCVAYEFQAVKLFAPSIGFNQFALERLRRSDAALQTLKVER